MALIALASAGGAPGVSTTALALAFTWPRPVLAASCDPAGCGWRAGYLAQAAREGANAGLVGWLADARRATTGGDGELLRRHLLVMDPEAGGPLRYVLPGLTDPAQAGAMTSWWPVLAEAFTALGVDVVADVGRLGDAHTPVALLQRADLVVLVVRPTLRQLFAARPRVQALRHLRGDDERLLVVLVAAPSGQDSRSGDIARTLGIPVVGELVRDDRHAPALSEGAPARGVWRSPLLRSAATAVRGVCERVHGTETIVAATPGGDGGRVAARVRGG